jgi:hypothetical protein
VVVAGVVWGLLSFLERRPLQELLQQTTWTDAIDEATAIPLERVFENASYEVFRFQ